MSKRGHGLAILFLLLLSLAFVLRRAYAARGEKFEGKNGVVATDETECSRIGAHVLRQGGHAVDAAVAATLCIGVLSPADSGLGGGGFILVRPAKGEPKVFDMREMAPARASKDMFSNMSEFQWKLSPLSIAVPGQLAGLYKVHKQYGKLPWSSLVKPAEALARRGFKISESLYNKMAGAESTIMADEELRSIFAPNGEILVAGQTLRLKRLANTLAAIAKHGMDIFYNGSIAQGLAEDIKRVNGIVTKEDLQKYRVIIREPLVANVLGYKMLTVPPPASGGAMVILILKTLSKYNTKDVPPPLLVHRTIEALKYALALRMNLGDPGFLNISNALQSMISDSTAEKLRNLIDDNRTFEPPHYGSKWSQLNDHGTSHICIVDRHRNVVTMTTSINTRWGSKVMSPSTGIFLNNQMYDFSIPTSKTRPGAPANYVSPFKRPLSSMAPTILEKDGRVRVVIGSAGGLLIPDAVTQVLLNFFILKKKSFDAVRAARFYHRLYPNLLLHENYSSSSGDRYTYPSSILKELKNKGHKLKNAASGMTTCQFVVQKLQGNKSGLLIAVSDPRKGGFPADERVVARNGVVATDETECSKIGRDILRRGGHAVDAAVAAALCLGVVSPPYSGLGGGGFMLVRSSNGTAHVFDMRETAPGRASKDMFGQDKHKWATGPLSIAVPGQLAGLFTAHKQYGKIPWESLVKPAENLARKGFSVSPSLFKAMSSVKSVIMADRELRGIFAPSGRLLSKGNTIRLGKLADTLAAISKHGMNIFYNGSIAQNLTRDIQTAGGIMRNEDFQKYQAIIRKPLVAHAFGYEIVTAPPPASGGAMMILILKILSKYNATGTPEWLEMHRFIEALKYALAMRLSLGDPRFVNITNVLSKMTSTSYAEELKNRINDKKTYDPAHYGSNWSQIYDHGTTHLCTVDSQRNVVTMTISLNSYFGSKLMSPSTGIFLNNQMYDFSIPKSSTPPPSPANFIQPFKRPLSSMAPTILVKGGRVKAVIGAAGGILIPDAVTQVLINFLHRKLDPLVAVKVPRLYHMLYPNVLYHEEYISQKGGRYSYHSKILKELKKKGHVLKTATSSTSCQLVVQILEGPDSGQLIAVSDQRKGGSPAGY